VGRVLSSIFGSRMGEFLAGKPVSSGTADRILVSWGAALGYAGRAAGQAPALAQALAHTASESFVEGMHAGVIVAGSATLIGAIVAAIWLPARARASDVAGQEASRAELDGSAPRAATRDTASTPAHAELS
jgi:hypothetical protein